MTPTADADRAALAPDPTEAHASDGGRLTDRAYWQRKQEAGRDDPPGFDFFDQVARQLPSEPGSSLLEIGCAPGRILAKFCRDLGYEAHGIDFAADPEEVAAYLRRHNVRVGEIHGGDFFRWEPGRTYDVVASFGFIEHFDDPEAALHRHFALVRPGGHVVVGVPNFARGQGLLHWVFDRENLRRHNLSCMSLRFFRAAAQRHGAEIVSLRYTGGHYDLWRETPRSARWGVKASSPRVWLSPTSTLHLALRWLAQLRPEAGNPLFSPFILAIYRAPELDAPRGGGAGGSSAFFDAEAARYDAAYTAHTPDGHALRSRNAAVHRQLGDGPGELLDAGMGAGQLALELDRRGWTVTGVDLSDAMVATARAKLPEARDRLLRADLQDLPFADASFDAACAIGSVEFAPDLDAALRELTRVVRPGGALVVTLPNVRAVYVRWRFWIAYPLLRALKRAAPFGRPAPMRRPWPPGVDEFTSRLRAAGAEVERVEHANHQVALTPLDVAFPDASVRLAERLEASQRRRERLLATQLVIRARRTP